MALPVEYAARIDHQAGRMDFPRDNALCLDLDAALGKDDSIELPCNHDVIAFNLPFHASPFAENQAVAGDQVSLHLRLDPKYAGRFKGSLETHAFVEEASEFMLPRILVT